MIKKSPFTIEIALGLVLTGFVVFGYLKKSTQIETFSLKTYDLLSRFRHANAKDQLVRIRIVANTLTVAVSDGGPGFDTSAAVMAGRIGLAGMRERIQALGGSFELHSSPGQGTTIEAILPTRVPGDDRE